MPRSKFSDRAKALLDQLEGNKLEGYLDGGGVPTIGRGSTRDVVLPMTITETQSDARFEDDICTKCNAVDSALGPDAVDKLTSNQYSAFVIFAYNVRLWWVKPITQHMRAGDLVGASAHWLLYDKITVDGQMVPSDGLLNRRKAELALFQDPHNV